MTRALLIMTKEQHIITKARHRLPEAYNIITTAHHSISHNERSPRYNDQRHNKKAHSTRSKIFKVTLYDLLKYCPTLQLIFFKKNIHIIHNWPQHSWA